MIATHTPKIFNARLQQSALNANIITKHNPCLISSQTVKNLRKYFAAPLNGADIKITREKIANLAIDEILECKLPDIEDSRVKQLLLPRQNWQNNEYLSITPVASMSVVEAVTTRLVKLNLPFRRWVIQPNPAAWVNHGEFMLLHGGAVRMLVRGCSEVDLSEWKGSCVQLTARVEGMNISSGMVALGFPAITAIGGYIHTLERSTGFGIDFAIGFKNSSWNTGIKATNTASFGRNNYRGSVVVPTFVSDEVVATCEIVLLLKSDGDLKQIAKEVEKITRLAGGSVFDVKCSILNNEQPENASFLVDACDDVLPLVNANTDVLDAALQLYAGNGKWQKYGEKSQWFSTLNKHTINMIGYALLENPQKRNSARNNYLHAWAEPIFSVVKQSSVCEKAFWRRNSTTNNIIWTAGV